MRHLRKGGDASHAVIGLRSSYRAPPDAAHARVYKLGPMVLVTLT